MGFAGDLVLHGICWSGARLQVHWGVDDVPVTTTLTYESVDWDVLATTWGSEVARRLALHVALFQLNTGLSFGPERLVLAPEWGGLVTPQLAELWRVVGSGVWAQWRYQHDLPDYRAPLPVVGAGQTSAIVGQPGPTRSLWFCGGGKDSLLASALLDRAGEPYDALSYSHSDYGDDADQFRLVDALVDTTAARQRHRIRIHDTTPTVGTGAGTRYDGVRSVVAAETPASLFATLPVALVHGHSYLVLAHERSANTGNLIWDATGEDVNHQWGKSLAAERLLGDYVRTSLLAGVEYFSVLQPVHDAAIFAALSSVADRVPLAHSCNVAKPWCRRCPKCAYVWISYRAWLPGSVVDAAFGPDNLLDRPENQLWYRQLLGLEAHTPFECVGLVEETRLAFALARARGVEGRAMALLDEVGPVDVDRLRSRYLSVEASDHRIPPALAGPVLAALRTCSDKVLRRRLVDELPGDGPVGGRAVMTSRRATRDDVERLQPLVEAAIVENQRPFLDVDQIRSSQAIMGIDTQLIDDGTYFVVEIDGVLAGCGGWSRRATLYGGDHSAARDSALLDPATQPAKVRAMYTHPRLTRRGVGRRILELCEQAAAAEGFTALELMATHSGRPLYEAFGFLAIEEVEDATGGAPVPLTRMRKRI